jgi:hypothetical protein
MNVPVIQPVKRSNLWIAGLILLIAILGSGVLAVRWWSGQDAARVVQSTPTPTPTPTATPTPTPTPVTASSKPSPQRRDSPQPKKPSTIKRAWDKFKKALPF